jgi:uncharacterized protein YjbI with pentapeptide repeats
LRKTQLQNINFSDADFSDANLTGACLDKSLFFNASFDNACLNSATFKQAKLNKSSIKAGFAYDADFRESILTQACFDNTHLQGSRFNKSTLDKATFADSNFDDCESWEKRYWSYEEHCLEDMHNSQFNHDYDDYDDEDYEVKEKVDFRESTLTIEQAKSAQNWEKAIYDSSLRQKLGLSNHEDHETEYKPKM